MARKLRIQYEGAIYHVTMRGVERRTLFQDNADRERFLTQLSESTKEYSVRLYLFCLMDNHVHLLLETPQANLSAFMHRLQTAYTVYFNLRHKRTGHLMQGRFGAQLVQGDKYLRKLSRYIHLNPVFVKPLQEQPIAEKVKYLRSYSWSSYQSYIGLIKPHEFLEEAPLLALGNTPLKKRRLTYRRFVEDGIAKPDEEFKDQLAQSPWGLGDTAFQNRIRDMHKDQCEQAKRKEDVSFRRISSWLSANLVLKSVSEAFEMKTNDLQKRQYNCAARAVAALLLRRYAGMNQRTIGELLGMGTGSAVCRQLKRLQNDLVLDSETAARARKSEIVLESILKAQKPQA